MDEFKRFHHYAVGASFDTKLLVNTSGHLIVRTQGVNPPMSVDLTQAISELVDERIAKALQILEAQKALDKARGDTNEH